MKKGGGSESTIIMDPSKSVLIYALHSLEKCPSPCPISSDQFFFKFEESVVYRGLRENRQYKTLNITLEVSDFKSGGNYCSSATNYLTNH